MKRESLAWCRCGNSLLVDEGESFYVPAGWRLYKDTGRVVVTCNRCGRSLEMEAHTQTIATQTLTRTLFFDNLTVESV